MKTYPIAANMNFSGLYIDDSLCSKNQKDEINVIKGKLTDAQIVDIKNKGYDVFLTRTPNSDTHISVSAVKNFDFSTQYKRECTNVEIGNYSLEDEENSTQFDVNDIYEGIDKFETKRKKENRRASIVGISALLFTMVVYGYCLYNLQSKMQKKAKGNPIEMVQDSAKLVLDTIK